MYSFSSYVNDQLVHAYRYEYDENGYITKITYDDLFFTTYTYDDVGKLIEEYNVSKCERTAYTYDDAGNLTTITKTNTSTNQSTTVTMQYSGDRLISYNGKTISYDAYGNPLHLSKGKQSLAWEGNRLASSAINSIVTMYTYDAQGLRRTKTTSSGVTTDYIYEGTTLIGEIRDSDIFIYLYDESGSPIGMQYRRATGDEWDIFWFEKNLQGDIVAVYMDDGTQLLTYSYDAWGNATIEDAYVTNGIDLNIAYARKNPFRYRGYYYDDNLQLYWLQTRYYDPAIGHFISPDDVSYLGANGDLNSYNLYAYCSNNPVMYVDPSGHSIVGAVLAIVALGGLAVTIGGVATGNNTATAVGLTMVAVPALISGGMAICAGFVGAPLLLSSGIITVGAGLGAGLFASAEYQQAITGNNWMLDAGMSEGWYNGLMITTATIATVGTFASIIGTQHYNNTAKSWLNGRKAMRNHFRSHGSKEMGYRTVFAYTNDAKNIINTGSYIPKSNAYVKLCSGRKYLYVGVGRDSQLITTFSYRTFNYAKLLSLL